MANVVAMVIAMSLGFAHHVAIVIQTTPSMASVRIVPAEPSNPNVRPMANVVKTNIATGPVATVSAIHVPFVHNITMESTVVVRVVVILYAFVEAAHLMTIVMLD